MCHHLPPYSILCAWPWDQHPNVILSRDSQVGVPKFSQLRLWRLWGPITLCVDFWLRWGLKKSYKPCWELSNGMSHTTCIQGSQGDSWLLVVGSQIANLTLNPSFGYNLCVKCSNGSCESILDVKVPRAFQWYKELINSMSFEFYNRSLKIWESIGTLTPKVEVHLGVWRFIPSHFLAIPGAWNVTHGLPSWLAPSQALALVTSPSLGLRQHVFLTWGQGFEWQWLFFD
jgi:hypothetical protein